MVGAQSSWSEVVDLVGAALDLDPSQRRAFLAQAAVDPEVRCEAESLLAAEENETSKRLDHSLASLLYDPGELDLAVDEIETRLIGEVAGRTIGRYRVIRELDSGGMGTVYEAERADGEFEQTVALKVIRSVLPTERLLRRFHAERQILARLHHPNIGQLLDAGTMPDGRPYLVMEYINGVDLCTYADTHQLSVRARLRMFLSVCSGVQAAHQALIIHCDLKPSNILVGADGFPKLLDFGIANIVAETLHASPQHPATHCLDVKAAPLLSSAQLALTPAYASPEQWKGEALTTATDVYSLGILLCVLLSGSTLR